MQPRLLWLLLLFLAAGGTWAGLTADFNQVIFLAFDRYIGDRVYDNAPHHNNATLVNGALITKTDGSCGNCAQLLGGNIQFNGATFQGIPFVAITILMNIKLMDLSKTVTLFETIGQPPRSNHIMPQFILEVEYGRIRWFHRNENGTTVFSIITDLPVLSPGKWSNVAVTYDGLRGSSRVYIDGNLNKEEVADPGVFLSRDWSKYAGIGASEGDADLRGYVDEFYIYNRSLLPMEIKSVIQQCKGEGGTLVLHLGFEKRNSNIFLDDSGLSNDVTLSRPPTAPGTTPDPIPFINGSCGGGVQITGPTNDLSLDGKTVRNKPVDEITLAMWINVTSIEGIHYLFATIGGHSQHKHDQYRFVMERGVVKWTHHNEYDTKIFDVVTDPVVTANQWVHIVGTYNAQSKQAKVYINSDLNKQGIGSGTLSADWDSYAGFGRHPQGEMQAIDFMDEIYMYSKELSPYEVKMLYQACNFGNARKPMSSQFVYFSFDRVSGHTIYDDSGSGNNGLLSSYATVTKKSKTCGNGLRLEGGNILLAGKQILRKPLFSLTIALWVKLDTNVGTQTIFMTTDPDNIGNKNVQYLFQIINGTVVWFHSNEKSKTVFSAVTTAAVVPAGTWTHIAGTYKNVGGKSEIYVNGEKKKEEWTGGGTLSQDWNGRVSIGKFLRRTSDGKWEGNNEVCGVIDELYMFDRALSPTEITLLGQTCNYQRFYEQLDPEIRHNLTALLYLGRKPGKVCSPIDGSRVVPRASVNSPLIVLHFGFEVFDGQITYDQSGLANNGKVLNGTTAEIGKCGKGLNLTGGMIKLVGDKFKEKPQKAITISVWISLTTNRGYHEIFNTIGSRSEHKHDQYNFAVDTGKVIWYHHQEQDKQVFNLVTLPVIPARVWTHIVVMYNSRFAEVYINGKLQKRRSGSGDLSQDWGHFAGIGYHFYEKTYLRGIIDEFVMYNYALKKKEIEFLAEGRCGRR